MDDRTGVFTQISLPHRWRELRQQVPVEADGVSAAALGPVHGGIGAFDDVLCAGAPAIEQGHAYAGSAAMLHPFAARIIVVNSQLVGLASCDRTFSAVMCAFFAACSLLSPRWSRMTTNSSPP